jgi:hypothetical protein
MKTKEKILIWMSIILVILIFLAYFFMRYTVQIETLSSLSVLTTKQKELENKLVILNQQKSQLNTELTNLNKQKTQSENELNSVNQQRSNFARYSFNRLNNQSIQQIQNLNVASVQIPKRINEIKTNIDKKNIEIKNKNIEIDKTTKEIDYLKKITTQPFDVIINDITNYPNGFIKPKQDSFVMNYIMTGMPDIIPEPSKLDIGNGQTISISNDTKANTILVISPDNDSSFPRLFTINIKYSGDKAVWGLYTADTNRDFMPNYEYSNQIIESTEFPSKFLHDKTTYKISDKNIKIANVNLGNKIMSVLTTGDAVDKDYKTYAKVEMDMKGMKIEFLNENDTVSGIIIILSPKTKTNPNE